MSAQQTRAVLVGLILAITATVVVAGVLWLTGELGSGTPVYLVMAFVLGFVVGGTVTRAQNH